MSIRASVFEEPTAVTKTIFRLQCEAYVAENIGTYALSRYNHVTVEPFEHEDGYLMQFTDFYRPKSAEMFKVYKHVEIDDTNEVLSYINDRDVPILEPSIVPTSEDVFAYEFAEVEARSKFNQGLAPNVSYRPTEIDESGFEKVSDSELKKYITALQSIRAEFHEAQIDY